MSCEPWTWLPSLTLHFLPMQIQSLKCSRCKHWHGSSPNLQILHSSDRACGFLGHHCFLPFFDLSLHAYAMMWETAINQEEVKCDTESKSLEGSRSNPQEQEQFTENYPAAYEWTEANTLQERRTISRWLFVLRVLTPFEAADLKH